ncbi:MAG TPA: GvpL/GvpF family gas vesicle protein [Thermoanaerobaculia bacterium]|nr:GvpL/GvpF family gas vesicle protein [Thermoanaerobaculia bacterium]
MTDVLYLYAVAFADIEPTGPLGTGIGDEPLTLIPVGGLVAVAGSLPGRPSADAETLKKQDAVVRRLAGLFAALLPVRFGESAADEAAVAAKIAPRESALTTALHLVRGCVQMTLRVFGEPDPAPEPALAMAGGPGARYLEARRREQLTLRSLPEIGLLSLALRPLLRAERIERQAAGPLLGTAYHLVPREGTAAYLAAVEEARGRIGGRRIAATGPWPPYAFAPEGMP